MVVNFLKEIGMWSSFYLNLDSTPLSESRPISLKDSKDSTEEVLLLKLPTANKVCRIIKSSIL